MYILGVIVCTTGTELGELLAVWLVAFKMVYDAIVAVELEMASEVV